ncbi:MAG: aminoacyl-tRNA hydrolase [Limibacillus sp.]
MQILVGLGNPGPRYAANRHNIGFLALEAIARRHNAPAWRGRFQGRAAEATLDGEKCLLLCPETYMNNSGQSVGEALRFYKLPPDKVTVFYDELDLRPGKMKVKWGGGAAGHNGIRSLIAHIGPDFRRVRLGIGHPGNKDLVMPWVLGDFAKADRDWLEPLLDALASELPLLVKGDEGSYMSRVAYLTGDKTSGDKTSGDKTNPEKKNDES